MAFHGIIDINNIHPVGSLPYPDQLTLFSPLDDSGDPDEDHPGPRSNGAVRKPSLDPADRWRPRHSAPPAPWFWDNRTGSGRDRERIRPHSPYRLGYKPHWESWWNTSFRTLFLRHPSITWWVPSTFVLIKVPFCAPNSRKRSGMEY